MALRTGAADTIVKALLVENIPRLPMRRTIARVAGRTIKWRDFKIVCMQQPRVASYNSARQVLNIIRADPAFHAARHAGPVNFKTIAYVDKFDNTRRLSADATDETMLGNG